MGVIALGAMSCNLPQRGGLDGVLYAAIKYLMCRETDVGEMIRRRGDKIRSELWGAKDSAEESTFSVPSW